MASPRAPDACGFCTWQVRDLRGVHVPMLRELRAGVMAELHRRYAAVPTSIRAYFHYPPSFWHAHVHFAALTCPAMGANVAAGKAILLDDVIDALERDGGHFETANLSILVGENDPLYKRLADANAL